MTDAATEVPEQAEQSQPEEFNTVQEVVNDLTRQLSEKTLENSILRANLKQAQQHVAHLQAQLDATPPPNRAARRAAVRNK